MRTTPRTGRAVALAGLLLWLASVVLVMVRFPDGTPMSSDAGAPRIPTWVTVVPALLGIAVALVLPRPTPGTDRSWASADALVRPGRRRPVLITTAGLLLLAIAFPVLGRVLGAKDVGYIGLKVLLLIVVAALLVGLVRGAVLIGPRSGAWRWWAPVVAVLAWAVPTQLWAPPHDLGGIDPVTLAVGASLTALTASVGEEVFYRRWLQTRLEALLGAAGGITVASLAFALMHLASHGQGDPITDVARVIVAQGSFGVLTGVLWWRYRNLAAPVLAHLVSNGWVPLVTLLGG